MRFGVVWGVSMDPSYNKFEKKVLSTIHMDVIMHIDLVVSSCC